MSGRTLNIVSHASIDGVGEQTRSNIVISVHLQPQAQIHLFYTFDEPIKTIEEHFDVLIDLRLILEDAAQGVHAANRSAVSSVFLLIRDREHVNLGFQPRPFPGVIPV